MMILTGHYKCDYCNGSETGIYYKATGNHVQCQNEAEMKKSLEICVMFLTNTNTITDEKQVELISSLKASGMIKLADMIAVGGMASMLTGEN